MPVSGFCRNRSLMTIFFFQAEDGIRDYKVTGVQTCALPISEQGRRNEITAATSSTVSRYNRRDRWKLARSGSATPRAVRRVRSEEGRGGEEGRSRGAPDHLKKKNNDRSVFKQDKLNDVMDHT